jgi:hypothetical protein
LEEAKIGELKVKRSLTRFNGSGSGLPFMGASLPRYYPLRLRFDVRVYAHGCIFITPYNPCRRFEVRGWDQFSAQGITAGRAGLIRRIRIKKAGRTVVCFLAADLLYSRTILQRRFEVLECPMCESFFP